MTFGKNLVFKFLGPKGWGKWPKMRFFITIRCTESFDFLHEHNQHKG